MAEACRSASRGNLTACIRAAETRSGAPTRRVHGCRVSRVVSFPRPLWLLVSRDVLVETWAPGRIVRDFVYSDTVYNRKIARTGLRAYLQMMLVVRPSRLPPRTRCRPMHVHIDVNGR